MKGKCWEQLGRTLIFIVVTLTIFTWVSASVSSPTVRFTVLTLAVPSSGIPLPLQLVLAYGWQLQVAKEGVGYPWWTVGGFGVDFVTDEESEDDLKTCLLQVWRQTNWYPLVVRQARSLSSRQIQAWKREPMEWLRWQARIIAIGEQIASLNPEQPSRISLDDVSAVLRKLSQYPLPLLHHELTNQTQPFPPLPLSPPAIRSKFQQTLRSPSPQRTHGLWWMLMRKEPVIAMVVGELLGGGTGARWYQLLRGEKPIAYHAVAQVQWTVVGAELTLYAATVPENFKLARQRAQQLLLSLRQGKIDSSEFERAKELAGLRLRQITSDPINLSRMRAIWLMSGRSLNEWESLPERLQSLSLEEFRAFCRSLPPTAEIIALP
ncbi:MAG: insulinase family protein [Armatimonadota bacterium]